MPARAYKTHYVLWMAELGARGFWHLLEKLRWLHLHGFISGSSVSSHWSGCLFLCQYHVLIPWLCGCFPFSPDLMPFLSDLYYFLTATAFELGENMEVHFLSFQHLLQE